MSHAYWDDEPAPCACPGTYHRDHCTDAAPCAGCPRDITPGDLCDCDDDGGAMCDRCCPVAHGGVSYSGCGRCA